MQFQYIKEKIVIVDFGSQVTKLIARRIRESGVYSEILTPLQIKKIKDNSPLDIQTGPAMRKDYGVIKSHIEMILDDDIKDIYQRITNHIIKTHEADN